MKTYRPARQLLAEIEQVLGQKYTPRSQPLEDVLALLQEGRNYSYAGIFLVLDHTEKRQFAGKELRAAASVEESTRRFVVPIKLPGIMLGVLHVETERENGFSSTDRVLLTGVATKLAHFLTGKGKYLLRRAKLQPAVSGEPAPAKGAAAGEKNRS